MCCCEGNGFQSFGQGVAHWVGFHQKEGYYDLTAFDHPHYERGSMLLYHSIFFVTCQPVVPWLLSYWYVSMQLNKPANRNRICVFLLHTHTLSLAISLINNTNAEHTTTLPSSVYSANQAWPTPFYSVLVSISVFMALSTVFHSINSPDNSQFPNSVLISA